MGTHHRQQGRLQDSEGALQHARLQELVAALVDGELQREERSAVEEHLMTCRRCGRELALQQALSKALAWEPRRHASAGLRRRIDAMGEPAARPADRALIWTRRWVAPAVAALAVAAAAAGTAVIVRRGEVGRQRMAEVPVLRDALADCRRAMARDFPRKADLPALREGLQFPVRPLQRPGVELFSTWKTTLAGSPAAALAYRWRGIVVVQYTLATEVVRQQPMVAEALSGAGYYAASELGQGVVAVLEGPSGTVLIADAPPEELRRLIL